MPDSKRTPRNRRIGLIILTLATSVFVGAWLGWNFPYFQFPILSQQATTK